MHRTESNLEIFKLHWVDPEDLEHIAGTVSESEPGAYHIEQIRPSAKDTEFGSIEGGDWDEPTHRFDSLLNYQAFRDHFVDGVPWDETKLYHRHAERIEDEYRSYGCRSIGNLQQKFESYDELYQKIETEGYRSVRELQADPLHDIRISIGRSGRLLYHGEGRHRLCIAKILSIDEIPVLVHTRHQELVYPKSAKSDNQIPISNGTTFKRNK